MITTLNGLRTAKIIKLNFQKTMGSMSAGNIYSSWRVAGYPEAGANPTATLAGENLTNASVGAFALPNAPAGQANYLHSIIINPLQSGTFMLYDRLWQTAGPAVTLTTAQTINNIALPSRAVLRNVELFGDVATGTGAGTGNFTITYKDQNNNATETAPLHPFTANMILGQQFLFNMLNGGDLGFTQLNDFTRSATQTSGAMGFVFRQLIAQLNVAQGTFVTTADYLDIGLVKIPASAALELCWRTIGNAPTIQGTLVVAQG